MIRRVGQRISAAVEKYYAEKGKSGDLEGYKWEYNLVDSKEINAWCMPGGKNSSVHGFTACYTKRGGFSSSNGT